jgi:hypothetical protein
LVYTGFCFIQAWIKQACLNQTLDKTEACLNQTLDKTEACLNQTLDKTEACLNQTLETGFCFIQGLV